MATQTPLAGWTEKRKRRSWLLVTGALAAGVAIWWAMYLPWAGLTLSTAEPVCVTGAGVATESFQDPVGQVVHVRASGCWSAYQSVQSLTPTQDAAPTGALTRDATPTLAVKAPYDAPKIGVRAGYPAMTVYAALAAAAAAVTAMMRNAAFIVPAPLLLSLSNSAFVDHRLALPWGMGPSGAEMVGVSVHQVAYWAVVVAVAATALFVVRVNNEQRKLDNVPHPVTRALGLAGSVLFRGAEERLAASLADKLGETTSATAAPAKATAR